MRQTKEGTDNNPKHEDTRKCLATPKANENHLGIEWTKREGTNGGRERCKPNALSYRAVVVASVGMLE